MRSALERMRARRRAWIQSFAEHSVVRYWDWRADSHASQPGQRCYLDRWRSIFAESFPVEPAPLEVLDVGTGTGFCALPLARLGHRVTAVDLSPGMLAGTRAAALEEGLEVSFIQADAAAPVLAPESFDGVVARNLLWTLPRPAESVRRWYELLRPGGSLLISDGLWNPPARSACRVLSGLLPGNSDRSGLRFEASYLAARRRLPLYRGLDASCARSLLLEAGLKSIEQREQIFEEDPFGLPGSGFFILAAHKPGVRKPEARKPGGWS